MTDQISNNLSKILVVSIRETAPIDITTSAVINKVSGYLIIFFRWFIYEVYIEYSCLPMEKTTC